MQQPWQFGKVKFKRTTVVDSLISKCFTRWHDEGRYWDIDIGRQMFHWNFASPGRAKLARVALWWFRNISWVIGFWTVWITAPSQKCNNVRWTSTRLEKCDFIVTQSDISTSMLFLFGYRVCVDLPMDRQIKVGSLHHLWDAPSNELSWIKEREALPECFGAEGVGTPPS